ncbi:hypothetical protein FGB62_58g035 [Gracilaria domingensis]|nr:hypothetical protein FGB62_58g035 [Gracilaria domingensis]
MLRPPPFSIPGPAGVLPSQAAPAPPSAASAPGRRASPPHSTFTSRTWRAMLHARQGQPLRSSLALLRRNALMSCRAPLDDLPVLVDGMEPIVEDLSFLLVDPTHRVHATISHSSLDAPLRERLKRGAVLVLNQVSNTLLLQGESAFARGHSQDVHLIIHRANIKNVFSISDELPLVDMPPFSSSSQLKKWALQPYSQYAAQPPPVPKVHVPPSIPTSYRLPRPSSSHSASRPSTPSARVQNPQRPSPSAYNPSRINISSRAVQKPFHVPRRRLPSQMPPIPNPTHLRTSRPSNAPTLNQTPSNHAANLVSDTDFEAILGNLDVDAIVQATRNNHTVQGPPATDFVATPEPDTTSTFTASHLSVSNLNASPQPTMLPQSQHTSTPSDQPWSHPPQPQSISNSAAAPAKPDLSALDQQTIDDLFD